MILWPEIIKPFPWLCVLSTILNRQHTFETYRDRYVDSYELTFTLLYMFLFSCVKEDRTNRRHYTVLG